MDVLMGVFVIVPMFVVVVPIMGLVVRMRMVVRSVCMFFSGGGLAGKNLDLGRAQTAAHHFARFEFGAHIERARGVGKKIEGNTGIDHCAQQHIAADTGKAVQIAYTHRG
jgi:hypothetical protein